MVFDKSVTTDQAIFIYLFIELYYEEQFSSLSSDLVDVATKYNAIYVDRCGGFVVIKITACLSIIRSNNNNIPRSHGI